MTDPNTPRDQIDPDQLDTDQLDDADKIVVLDPDDYRQTQTLRHIYNAKRNYAKVRADSNTDHSDLITAIQQFILELKPIINEISPDPNPLTDAELGPVTHANPNLEITFGTNTGFDDHPELENAPDNKDEAIQHAFNTNNLTRKTFTGLNTIVEHDCYYTYKVSIRHTKPGSQLVATTKKWPVSITNTAYDKCNQFMHDAGLGLKLDTDTPDEWEINV